MAGTVRVQIKIDHKNGGTKQNEPQATVTTTQTGKAGAAGVQKIGTSPTAINKGSVGTIGNLYFRNDDDTAVIDIGVFVSATFHLVSTLQPGQQATFPGGTTGTDAVYYAQSDTVDGELWVNIHEA